MWRVIIADDEQVIRMGMNSLVNWSELGCEVVYLAKNGQDLLDAVERCRPDIVITDISMPVMDGLMAVGILREKHPQIEVIILTAYSDFSYAKKAIQYDVVDYVVKTAFLQDIPVAVRRAIEKLSKEGGELNSFVRQQRLLRSITDGTLDFAQLTGPDRYALESVSRELQHYRLVMVYTPEMGANKEAHAKAKQQNELLSALFSERGAVLFRTRLTKYCILVDEKRMSRKTLTEVSQQALLSMRQFLGLRSQILIGDVWNGLEELYAAYGEVDSCCMRLFTDGEEKVYFVDQLPEGFSGKNSRIAIQTQTLMQHLQLGEYEQAAAALDTLKGLYAVADAGAVKSSVLATLYEGGQLCKRYGESMESLLGEKHLDVLVIHSKSLDALTELVNRAVEEIIALLTHSTGHVDSMILRVDAYISTHYAEKLSLVDIANAIHMNKSYLSRIYKEKTGVNLFDAIAKLRVEAAKKLIETSDMQIREIAAEVGVEDSSYFSKVFRKYVGVSPREYELRYRRTPAIK